MAMVVMVIVLLKGGGSLVVEPESLMVLLVLMTFFMLMFVSPSFHKIVFLRKQQGKFSLFFEQQLDDRLAG